MPFNTTRARAHTDLITTGLRHTQETQDTNTSRPKPHKAPQATRAKRTHTVDKPPHNQQPLTATASTRAKSSWQAVEGIAVVGYRCRYRSRGASTVGNVCSSQRRLTTLNAFDLHRSVEVTERAVEDKGQLFKAVLK